MELNLPIKGSNTGQHPFVSLNHKPLCLSTEYGAKQSLLQDYPPQIWSSGSSHVIIEEWWRESVTEHRIDKKVYF